MFFSCWPSQNLIFATFANKSRKNRNTGNELLYRTNNMDLKKIKQWRSSSENLEKKQYLYLRGFCQQNIVLINS